MQGQSLVQVCKYDPKYARPVFGPSNHNPGSKQGILGMPVLSVRKTFFYIRDGLQLTTTFALDLCSKCQGVTFPHLAFVQV